MSQKSFLCSSFNPFYPLKCVLGAGENELESVQCLAFLSTAITEDPQRLSKKLKQTKRSVLAVLCEIIVSPLDPSYYFFAFCSLACFPLPFKCLPLLCSLIFYSLYRFLLHAYFSSPIFCHPPLFSFHLIFSFLLPFCFIWWASKNCTVYRKWKMHFHLLGNICLYKDGIRGL